MATAALARPRSRVVEQHAAPTAKAWSTFAPAAAVLGFFRAGTD
jgi:hypothetical protein